MENPIAIANFFIQKSLDSGTEMTQMKLIKLVYISHGWYLALRGKPLLSEPVEAWKYGPVVKSVYHEAKKYGNGPITSYFQDVFGNTPMPTDPEVCTFLDRIWDLYGKLNGLQLSALTHKEGTPWYKTWNEENGSKYHSVIIRNDLIKNHYQSKLNPVGNGPSAQP
jgi:uncharacterized phage-associated protein